MSNQEGACGNDVNDLMVKRNPPKKTKRSQDNPDTGQIEPADDVTDQYDENEVDGPVNGDIVQNLMRNDDNAVANTPVEFGLKGYPLMPLLSLVAFVLDIGFDVVVLLQYHIEGQVIYFWFTFAFLVIPAIIVAFSDLTWMYVDHTEAKKKATQEINGGEEGEEMVDRRNGNEVQPAVNPEEADACTPVWTVARIALGFVSLGNIIRIIQHMCYIKKKRTNPKYKEYYSERALITKRDYALLNVIFAFTETYAQAALQLYIFTKTPKAALISIKGGSIISSLIFMPLAFADHYRSLRLQSSQGVIDKSRDMPWYVYIFYYFGVFGGMMFRIVSISMFYAGVPLIYSIPVVNLHCLIVFFWLLCYHKPTYDGLITKNKILRNIGKVLYTALYSVISMLFFVDLYERDGKIGSSKKRMTGYNIILYIESAIFVTCGFVLGKLDVEFYAMVLLVGCLMHVVFIANYYQFLHPTIGICYNCGENDTEKGTNSGAAQPVSHQPVVTQAIGEPN